MQSRTTQVLAFAGVAAVAALAVVAAVLLLGGSGTTSKESYGATVENTRDRVDFALERITRSQSVDELVSRIDEASALVADTATDLDDASVATGFEQQNVKLVKTLRSFSDELAGTSAQFQDPTFAGTLGNITSLSFPQWVQLNKIFAKMAEEGLAVRQLARH